MTEWIEDVQPPRDYADDDDQDAGLRVCAMTLVALISAAMGLALGYLLWSQLWTL